MAGNHRKTQAENGQPRSHVQDGRSLSRAASPHKDVRASASDLTRGAQSEPSARSETGRVTSGAKAAGRTSAGAARTAAGRHVASPEEQATCAAAYRRENWKRPAKKRIPLPGKIAIGVLCAVLVAAAAGVAVALNYVGRVNSQLQTIDEEVFDALAAPESAEDPFYVLVLGSDTREEGATGRSDTIMLARVDPTSQDVTLISIPRDTQVQLEGYGTQKINAAYAYGGVAGSVKAVSDFAGVPIAHVVEIDFSGFKEVVDALGGVTVDVPANTEYKGVVVPEGKQTLNGEQALVFARCRKTYTEGDYQRTKNQRQLVQAVAKEVLNAPVADMPALVSSLAASVSTDMSATDLADLAMKMRGMDISGMKTAVVPSHSGMEDGVSYVFVEEPAWSEMMARVEAGEDPNPDSSAQDGGELSAGQ